MATEIIMPKNGMDMKEGVLIRWLVEIGDKVEKGDPIMEIETDKVTMESESPATGVILAKYYDEGVTIPVLKTIGYIGKEGEPVPETAPDAELDRFVAETPRDDVAVNVSNVLQAEPKDTVIASGAKQSSDLKEYDYDVAVIGGGPAGYVAAIKAAQLGGKVILFEKDVVGGTCLNRGCIPTKTYIRTAEYIEHIKRASERGIINDPAASVDMPKVVSHKNQVVSALTGGVASLLKSNNVTVINGIASAKSANEVECENIVYTAGSIILCGGSVPGMPPIPGIDHKAVITSNEILDFTVLPDELIILGGGVIGCEIACAFNAFGVNVTIVEMLPNLVANMGKKVSETIEKALIKSGIKVYKDTKVTGIKDDNGKPVVVCETLELTADAVLSATGRIADLECLGALKDKIKCDRGIVIVNEKMETNITGVYAAGDLTGGMMLAHSAFAMAETAAANAMGGNVSCNLNVVPSGLYTMPEAAAVGLDEEAAKEKAGENLRVGFFPMTANGRSLASGEYTGFVQVMVDIEFCEILGVRIVAADAVEMIAEPAALMAIEVTADEVADGIIHAHPTYTEAFMEACADALGRCIHLPMKR